jgi:putative restriction endonuclease
MSDASDLPEPIPKRVATVGEYRRALLAIRSQLTDNMLAMLQFQYRAPDHSVTATDLAKSVGYATYRPANRQYGELGKLIAEDLNFTPPRRKDGTHMYWSALSTGDPEIERGEQWRFLMRPELLPRLRAWDGHKEPKASTSSQLVLAKSRRQYFWMASDAAVMRTASRASWLDMPWRAL